MFSINVDINIVNMYNYVCISDCDTANCIMTYINTIYWLLTICCGAIDLCSPDHILYKQLGAHHREVKMYILLLLLTCLLVQQNSIYTVTIYGSEHSEI